MKKLVGAIILVTVILMLTFSFSGCTQKVAEKMVEKAIEEAASKEGESVDVNVEESSISIKDKEGGEINIGSAKVPEGWPSAVPVNDKIQIGFSGSQKNDGKTNWNITGTYNGSGEELFNWYKQKIGGWNIDSETVTDSRDGGKAYSIQANNDKYELSLVITDSNGEVTVMLNINEK